MLIPQVKQAAYTGDTLFLPFSLTVQASAAVEADAARCAALLLPGTTVTPVAANAHIRADRQELAAEEYRLSVGERVEIAYGDYRGLRNALATLSGLLTAADGGYTVPCGQIADRPVAAHRGVMLDVARGIKPFEEFKADILLAAKARLNILHLHLFDSIGTAVAMDSLPPSCHLKKHYSKAQMAEIVELARVLALEIIPEFDMPAHSYLLTRNIPEVGCQLPEGMENTGWTVCAGSEESFRLYEAVINELAGMFPHSRYLHVGGDELEFADMPELGYLCHWDDCPRCRQRMAEEGLSDRQELLYYVMGRIHSLVKKAGRQMIMWSDQIDCTRPCPLPRDIIMHFWRVASPGRGPTDGCSLNAQLALGYTAINSHFPEVYIDEEPYMSQEKIADWRWDERPAVEDAYKGQVIGGELCAWTYGENASPKHKPDDFSRIGRNLPGTMMLVADKLWNGTVLPVTSDEYRQGLTRAVLGPHTPEGFDLFHAFGSLVLPKRQERCAYYDRITVGREGVTRIGETLEAMAPVVAPEDEARLAMYRRTVDTVLADWPEEA